MYSARVCSLLLPAREINFLKWMAYGVPVFAVSVIVAWLGLIKAFPPEEITQEKIDELMENQFKTGKFTTHDYKCLVLVVGLPSSGFLETGSPFSIPLPWLFSV